MTNNPSVQHKLRAEMLKAFPEIQDRQPRFEDLNAVSTPYLEAVVHETLRLSRTAGGYTREGAVETLSDETLHAHVSAMEDINILGYRIPKGTTIIFTTITGLEDESSALYSNSSIPSSMSSEKREKRDSSAEPVKQDPTGGANTILTGDKTYASRSNGALDSKRAEGSGPRRVGYWAAGTGRSFDPERWLVDGQFDSNAGPSLPFSAGQRGCFGKALAVRLGVGLWVCEGADAQLLELRLFMAQLNQTFFFASVPEELNGWTRYETVATHPKQCYIRPVSWDSPEAKVGA